MNPSATAGVQTGTSAARAQTQRTAAESQAASPFASLLGGASAPASTAPAESATCLASDAHEPRHEASDSKSSTDPALGVLLALGLEPLPAPPPLAASVGLLGAAASGLDADAADSLTGEAGEFVLNLDADSAQGRGARASGALAAAVAAALAEQAAALSEPDAAPAGQAGGDALKRANAMTAEASEVSTAPMLARTLAVSAAAAKHAAGIQREARSAGASATAVLPAKLAAPATVALDAAHAEAAAHGLVDPLASLRTADAETAVSAPRPARAGADFSAPLPGSPAALGSIGVGTSGSSPISAETASLDTLAKALEARTDTRGGSATPSLQTASGAERGDLSSTQFASALRESMTSLSSLHPAMPARLDPHSTGFTGVVAQQVAWQAETRIGRAEIRLEPEELGPIDIAVELDGDEIRAEFSSRSAEVRTLLESQVPKLRELLAEQGFSLADAQVGQERAAYSDAQAQREGFGRASGSDSHAQDVDSKASAPVIATRMRLGLVDDYA